MRKVFLLLCLIVAVLNGFSQSANSTKPYNLDSALHSLKISNDSTVKAQKTKRDSIMRAMEKADSTEAKKSYDNAMYWASLTPRKAWPVINAGEYSAIVTVKDPTEIPDPNQQYKLLFEVTLNNPDSLKNEINFGLTEVCREINLHIASGIPLKNITPVIVVHGGALTFLTTNEAYLKRHLVNNPNLKTIEELSKLGTKFIACGQAMAFFKVNREDLLPVVKVSLTAKTVLTNYQLKGYVLSVVSE